MIGFAQWLPALLICLVLAAIAWRLRNNASPRGEPQLETLGSTQLGPSQRLVAVRAADRVYLLAVTQQGVSRIGELDARAWCAVPEQGESGDSKAFGRGAGE